MTTMQTFKSGRICLKSNCKQLHVANWKCSVECCACVFGLHINVLTHTHVGFPWFMGTFYRHNDLILYKTVCMFYPSTNPNMTVPGVVQLNHLNSTTTTFIQPFRNVQLHSKSLSTSVWLLFKHTRLSLSGILAAWDSTVLLWPKLKL